MLIINWTWHLKTWPLTQQEKTHDKHLNKTHTIKSRWKKIEQTDKTVQCINESNENHKTRVHSERYTTQLLTGDLSGVIMFQNDAIN